MNILAEKQKNMLEKEISNEEYSKREAWTKKVDSLVDFTNLQN